MGPLSAKQHREYLALANKEKRELMKMAAEEARKDQLHQIKLVEATAKAAQGVIQKNDTHKVKMEELGGKATPVKPLSMPMGPLAAPTNPEAGPSDTVPAMLAPGEAVIPAEAAQDPANKPIIESLVQEGRDAQGYAKGTKKVKPRQIGGKGSKNKILSKLPTVNTMGFEQGTDKVQPKDVPMGDGLLNAAKAFLGLRGKQIDKKVDEATRGYSAGTTEVKKEAPLGTGMAEQGRQTLKGRAAQLAEQERKAMGYEAGTTYADSNTLSPEEYKRKYGVAFVPVPKDFGQKGSNIDMTPATQGYTSKDVSAIDAELSRKDLSNDMRRILEAERAKASAAPQYASATKTTPQQIERAVIPTGRSERDYRALGMQRWGEMQGNPPVPKKLTDLSPAELRGRAYDVQTGMRPSIEAPRKDEMKLLPIPKADVNEGRIPVAPGVDLLETKAPEKETQVAAPTADPDHVVSVLNSDEAQAKMVEFQSGMAQYEAENGEKPPKEFLARMFESIYGPTGLFREEDLGRFAVLAAGGLLTGGSLAGSVRYAAGDALKRGDARQAGEAAAAGEARKDIRELSQELDQKIPEYLAKNISAEDRERAINMRRKPVKTIQEQVARDRAVIQFLASKVDHTKEGKSPFDKDSKTGYLNGIPQRYVEVNGAIVLLDNQGKGRPLQPDEKFLSSDAYGAEYNRSEQLLLDAVTPEIKRIMGKDFDDSIPKAMRGAMHQVWSDVGGMDMRKVAAISADMFKGVSREELRNTPREAFEKAFYGKAVINVAGGAAAKYYTTTDRKPPSVTALANLGRSMEQGLAELNQNLAKEGKSRATLGAFANALQNKFDAEISDDKKRSLFVKARAAESDPNSKYYGMSPFMIWVSEGAQTK